MKRNVIFLFLAFFVVSCSSVQKRTKWTDKNMRLMIDPNSLSAESYVAVQTALVKDGTFTIVDRSAGFNAVKREQERTQRSEEDRYADKEKWAHWGKLYGVGAIVVGHATCYRAKPFFSQYNYVARCNQYLSIVNANTGEVIVAVQGQEDSPMLLEDGSFSTPATWQDITEQLISAYPKYYKPEQYSEGVQKYRDLSEEEAKRQREISSEK